MVLSNVWVKSPSQFGMGNVHDDLLSDITSMIDDQYRVEAATIQVGSTNVQSSSVINLVVATVLNVESNSI